MKLMRRILLICVLGIAVLCVGLFFVVRFLPETDLIRRSVQDKLREVTGCEITLDSLRVTSSLADPICVEVDGISLTSINGQTHASAGRIVLSPSFAGLLNRELSIRSITVSGLRVKMEQDLDGRIQHPFMPTAAVPLPSGRGTEEGASVAEPRETTDRSAGADSGSAPAESALKWSVKTVKLVDGRIEWVDRKIDPGRETVVTLTSLAGSLDPQSGKEAVAVNLSSQLNIDGGNIGSVRLDGSVQPFTEGRFPDNGAVSAISDRLLIQPLRMYFPAWLNVSPTLKDCSIRLSLEWDEGQIPRISATTELRDDSGQAAELTFQGEIEPGTNYSGIQRIRGQGRATKLPLRFVGPSLPPQFPISPESGTIESAMNVEWTRDRDWQLRGTVTLEDASPSAAWKQIAERVRVESDLQLNQAALSLDKLEIWGSARLASVKGKIEQPFASGRTLDLSGDVTLPAHWIKELTGKLSKGLTLKGPIPVRAHVRGPVEDLAFEVSGDMTAATAQWLPHFDKSPGNKATLALKGKIFRVKDGKVSKSAMNGRAQIEVSGARIRVAERGPWIEKSSLRLESKVLFGGSTVDLKDASLLMKGGPNSREILAATANLGDLGSSTPRINGHVSTAVDRELLTLAGLELPADLSITGKAKVKADVVGSPKDLNWNVDLPLANVDIAVGRSFRKPAAVTGSFKATGKWAHEELILSEGNLTLPGVTVRLRGNLLGRDGKFHGVTVTLNRSDAKDVARFFPAVGGARFAGPLEGMVHLTAGDKGLDTNGTVRLLGVDYRVEKAPWSLEKLHGTIQHAGGSLASEGITGRIKGVVEGNLKIKPELNNVSSLEGMTGQIKLEVGQGAIKAEAVRSTLNQARLLIGTLLNPQGSTPKKDLLEFESLTGQFDVKSSAARTENLQLKGPDFTAAAIGSLRLDNMALDALVGIHTVTVVGNSLGRIPEVQKLVKKHEELLKMTGLDKELGRLGIQIPKEDQPKPEGRETVTTPVTVIAKVRGPASSPEVMPMLEGSLNKNTLARLKSLMN